MHSSSVFLRHVWTIAYSWSAFSPEQNIAKRLLTETVVHWTLFWWRSVATMAAEKAILRVLFEEFSETDKIGINTCLILQIILDVTVTALVVQNKREHPNQVKGFVETVVPNYCDPTFASHFRMKRQTFQVKDNPLLPSETVMIYMTLLFLLWVLGLLLLITVVVLWYCNIYHYIIRGA